MLVLTRRLNESIRIGKDIVVTITSINGGKVRLGIEAPIDIPILREEVAERDAAEIKKLTRTREELEELAKKYPPPLSWFEDDEESPF